MTDKSLTMKLELVPLPVSDVDRAKAFYVDKIGFYADHDVEPTSGMRIVQLTPPGSACSIMLSTGMGDVSAMKPGSHKGLHLVVKDIEAAHAHLARNKVDVGEIQDTGDGIRYAYFSDPDGNSWELQEINL